MKVPVLTPCTLTFECKAAVFNQFAREHIGFRIRMCDSVRARLRTTLDLFVYAAAIAIVRNRRAFLRVRGKTQTWAGGWGFGTFSSNSNKLGAVFEPVFTP